MLRVFLVADGQGDYRMMPGGLCRIAGADPGIVSGQRGGSSKDTWVIAGAASLAAQSPFRRSPGARGRGNRSASAPRPVGPPRTCSGSGRYAERSENSARLLRSVLSRLTDGGASSASMRPAFLRVCQRQELLARHRGRRRHGAGARSVRWRARARTARRPVRSRRAPEPAFQRGADRACGRRRARSAVVRQLAAAQPADAALREVARVRRSSRRGARGHRRRTGVAGGGGRPRDGAHDARPGVALSQPRASSRAAAVHRDDARGQRGHASPPTRACSNGCSNCRTAC